MNLTYEIRDGGRSITCLVCGRISWNLHDVLQRYCARCHQFHDVMAQQVLMEAEETLQSPQTETPRKT